jgi:hypothetical protein
MSLQVPPHERWTCGLGARAGDGYARLSCDYLAELLWPQRSAAATTMNSVKSVPRRTVAEDGLTWDKVVGYLQPRAPGCATKVNTVRVLVINGQCQ